MYFEDLSSYCYYLKTPVSSVKNIGWLDGDHPYKIGNVDNAILQRLAKIILGNDIINTEVNKIRSFHPCSLANCSFQEIGKDENCVLLGASEIWIPSTRNGEFFASPSMIYHYIEKHKYLPPNEYLSAIMSFDFESLFNAQKVYLNIIKGHF